MNPARKTVYAETDNASNPKMRTIVLPTVSAVMVCATNKKPIRIVRQTAAEHKRLKPVPSSFISG